MRNNRFYLIAMVVALLAAIGACAPQAAPVPVPAPVAPPSAPTTPTPAATSALSLEEAAWQKVVEAARKEGKIVLYSYNLGGDVTSPLSRAFYDAYGIKLEVVTGLGSILIERLKSEGRAGQSIADTFDTDTSYLVVARDGGLTTPWGELPVLKQKGVWSMWPGVDDQGYILAIMPLVNSPYINSSLVRTDQEPKAWRDLLDPKWKGKISIGDPDLVPIPNRFFQAMTTQNILDKSYFAQLGKQELRFAATIREDASAVARGEASISFVSSAAQMAALAKEGAPLKALDMEEGVVVTGSATISLLKNAPHPNASRVFVNWLLSPEGQKVFTQAAGQDSIRNDVPSSLLQSLQLKPRKLLVSGLKDSEEAARLQREKVVKKIILGK